MRRSSPFDADDLQELNERLLRRAWTVVPMAEIQTADPTSIGMRHDVDNDLHPAVAFAEWEVQWGYRSTYYILHSAPYWTDQVLMAESLCRISEAGHEIGFHTNALAEALRQNRDPVEILRESLEELRSYGHPVTGVVAHGDPLCHRAGFVNDELFEECIRPQYGDPDRTLEHEGVKLPIRRIPLAEFGFEYEPNWISRAMYLSDSGGVWHGDFDQVVSDFPYPNGQLFALLHPCWWSEAFA